MTVSSSNGASFISLQLPVLRLPSLVIRKTWSTLSDGVTAGTLPSPESRTAKDCVRAGAVPSGRGSPFYPVFWELLAGTEGRVYKMRFLHI